MIRGQNQTVGEDVLPIKTTIEDVETLGAYLKSQVGWVPIDRVKKTIESKYADNRKLEAMKRLGLLERDGANIKLSDRGRAYASAADAESKHPLMASALREVQLYVDTIEWIHHSKINDPPKTVIGNYWHDKHQSQLEGAQGAALTDAVIFFMRVAGDAGLGKFTRGAGPKPESYFKTDASAIESFVVSLRAGVSDSGDEGTSETDSAPTQPPAAEPVGPASSTPMTPASVSVNTSPAVHVNIEIHIAADATAATVAEIFKNMRKYVLSNPADSHDPA